MGDIHYNLLIDRPVASVLWPLVVVALKRATSESHHGRAALKIGKVHFEVG